MRFDYTHGREARYILSLYGEAVEDHYYFHYYKAAKDMFNRIVSNGYSTYGDVRVSVSDLKKDVRKDAAKIRGLWSCE